MDNLGKIKECLTCINSIYDKTQEEWTCDLNKIKTSIDGSCDEWENKRLLKIFS